MSADALQLSTSAQAPVAPPAPTRDAVAARKAAEDFEAVFINEFLGSMFDGLQTDGPFGGGPGEQMFRSLMLDQYARKIAHSGGLGLADAVTRELTRIQEEQRQ
jgi:Rod binding domain-containing protein